MIRTNDSKICTEPKTKNKTLNSQSPVLRKKNKAWSIKLLDFKLYNRARVIKTVRYWHRKDTQNQSEQKAKLRNKPTCLWSISLHDKEGKNTQGKRQSLQKTVGKRGELRKEMKLDYFLTPYTKKKVKMD